MPFFSGTGHQTPAGAEGALGGRCVIANDTHLRSSPFPKKRADDATEEIGEDATPPRHHESQTPPLDSPPKRSEWAIPPLRV